MNGPSSNLPGVLLLVFLLSLPSPRISEERGHISPCVHSTAPARHQLCGGSSLSLNSEIKDKQALPSGTHAAATRPSPIPGDI